MAKPRFEHKFFTFRAISGYGISIPGNARIWSTPYPPYNSRQPWYEVKYEKIYSKLSGEMNGVLVEKQKMGLVDRVATMLFAIHKFNFDNKIIFIIDVS